jgi:AraC-like DNA-binding protein
MSVHIETIRPPTDQSFRLLRWRDNLKDMEQCDAGGRVTALEGAGECWHFHREMELTLVECGTGLRVVGDNIAQFTGPELVLLGPDLPHCWHGLRRSTGWALQFHWPLEHPLRAVPEFAPLERLWQAARRGLLCDTDLRERIAPRLADLAVLSAPARLGVLWQILAELASASARQMHELSRTDFSVREGARHQAGIERVIRRVLEHYSEPQPLAEILSVAGMSKASFARQFPRYTGSTFTEFLARVRLDHARQRIFTTDEPVGAIAFGVGFNHLSHFNRSYRQAFGHPPTRDRERR